MERRKRGHSNLNQWTERYTASLVPGVKPYYKQPLVLMRGNGCHIEDDQGNTYLDFFGGVLTISVGHAHPIITKAVIEQIQDIVHTSTYYISPSMVKLAERMGSITPDGLNRVFFTNSGTEANETAIAMAQVATQRQEVVALRYSYSGRSHLAMGLTGQAPWKMGIGGLGVPVRHAHNAYCYRCPFGKEPRTCGLECAKDFEEFFKTSTTGRPAAYIAEPIQGVGGFITPPNAFLYETVRTARRYGALFIDDEVQTGFGRTGKRFGIEHAGVTPDIMTFAKGLANGFPIGATITRDEVAGAYDGPTFSTFGGDPPAMRAALATLDVIDQEDLTTRSADLGAVLRQGLDELSDRFPMMGDVRGKGLMQGIEFVKDKKEPASDLASEFLEGTRAHGLLVGMGGLLANTIRIAPPMTVTRTEIFQALEAIMDTLMQMKINHPELSHLRPTRVHLPE